ncbi:MAG: hypothetical protein KGL42_08195 [Betaproteobacteria bacterium]|nr:hypothetical protein [Betaproteobacteria bacterium]
MVKLTALQVRNEAARRTEKVRTVSDREGLNLPSRASHKTSMARHEQVLGVLEAGSKIIA